MMFAEAIITFQFFGKHDSQFPNVTFSAYIKKHNYYSSY